MGTISSCCSKKPQKHVQEVKKVQQNNIQYDPSRQNFEDIPKQNLQSNTKLPAQKLSRDIIT